MHAHHLFMALGSFTLTYPELWHLTGHRMFTYRVCVHSQRDIVARSYLGSTIIS